MISKLVQLVIAAAACAGGAAFAGPVNINTADAATLASELTGCRPGARASHRQGPPGARQLRHARSVDTREGHRRPDRRDEQGQHTRSAIRRRSAERDTRGNGGVWTVRPMPRTVRGEDERGVTPFWRLVRYHRTRFRRGTLDGPHSHRRVPGRRPRYAFPSRHQSVAEGDAADRRQAADPVRGRRGARGGRRTARVRDGIVEASHRGSFRHRHRARAAAGRVRQARPARARAPHRPAGGNLYFRAPGRAARPRPRGAVREAGRRRRAVLRASRRRSDLQRRSVASRRCVSTSTSTERACSESKPCRRIRRAATAS